MSNLSFGRLLVNMSQGSCLCQTIIILLFLLLCLQIKEKVLYQRRPRFEAVCFVRSAMMGDRWKRNGMGIIGMGHYAYFPIFFCGASELLVKNSNQSFLTVILISQNVLLAF